MGPGPRTPGRGPDHRSGGGRNRSGVLRWLGRFVMATWKLALVLALVAGGVAAGGFLNFVHQVRGLEPVSAAAAPGADAVVVLTGGPRRIEAGLALLAADKARRMLISGVNPRTSDAALRNATVRDAEPSAAGMDNAERERLLACCVDTGRKARDTVGNAVEARDWVRAGGFDHVIVVTSDYHMQRSLLEFRRTFDPPAPSAETDGSTETDAGTQEKPSVRLTPWPVATPALRGSNWYREPRAVRLMVGEWGKYLSAQSKGWFGAEFLKQWFPDA